MSGNKCAVHTFRAKCAEASEPNKQTYLVHVHYDNFFKEDKIKEITDHIQYVEKSDDWIVC